LFIRLLAVYLQRQLSQTKIIIMKPTSKQLTFIENIEKNFLIKMINYGFLSNGSISILCKDDFGNCVIVVNQEGITT